MIILRIIDDLSLENRGSKRFNGVRVLLFPLAEQKRIVAMLEELLPLCERLK